MHTNDDSVKVLQERIKTLEEQILILEKGLIHDGLTGLKTRAFLEEEMRVYAESIANAGDTKRKEYFGFSHISLLFFDIDHFKQINDTYGHPTGDAVLKEIAASLQETLRTGDIAARWGGEEIVILLLGANEEDAFKTAQRISEKIKALRFPEAEGLQVTVSCGIATTRGGEAFDALLKRADTALYRAKESRDTIIKYSDMHESV